MNEKLRIKTEVKTKDEVLRVIVVSRDTSNNNAIVAECGLTRYDHGICDLDFDISPKYRTNFIENALAVVRSAIEKVQEVGGATQYFCWGIMHPEWPEVMSQVLPYNFYFTASTSLITAGVAAVRRKCKQFVTWRGFDNEPLEPVSGYLPVDHPALEASLVSQMKLICWMIFSDKQIALLTRYFLGRQLTDQERKSVLGQRGLVDRFDKCFWYQATGQFPAYLEAKMLLIDSVAMLVELVKRGKR